MEDELRKLEVYQIAHNLAVRIHAMTLALPPVERYEESPQIRRSSKRASASIVEGHTQRKYKAQYLLYLYRALGSSDESQEHLQLLRETGSLTDAATFTTLKAECEKLSMKLFSLIKSVEQRHETPNYLRDAASPAVEPLSDDLESLP